MKPDHLLYINYIIKKIRAQRCASKQYSWGTAIDPSISLLLFHFMSFLNVHALPSHEGNAWTLRKDMKWKKGREIERSMAVPPWILFRSYVKAMHERWEKTWSEKRAERLRDRWQYLHEYCLEAHPPHSGIFSTAKLCTGVGLNFFVYIGHHSWRFLASLHTSKSILY